MAPQRPSLLPARSELRYSFKYLDTSHPSFRIANRDAAYFRALLARLKELSTLTLSEFVSSRSSTLRIHRIDFGAGRAAVSGFGIPNGQEFDARAWQFAISANEHGRVHGFLLGDVFFIRWLDPDHNLYPGG